MNPLDTLVNAQPATPQLGILGERRVHDDRRAIWPCPFRDLWWSLTMQLR